MTPFVSLTIVTGQAESPSAADPPTKPDLSDLALEDFRWAYEVELGRAERADLLAAALLAATLPAGALLATMLDGVKLTSTGEWCVWAMGIFLFLCAFLAGWARFAFLPWTGAKQARGPALAVAPAKAVVKLREGPLNEGLGGAEARERLLAAWKKRVLSAEVVARQKVWILSAAMACLGLAGLAFAAVLVWGI